MKRFQQNISINKQHGAALLILAAILILTVALIMIGKKSRNEDKSQQQTNVNKILQDAKESVLAVAISHTTNPGRLPYPDRVTGGGFDGSGDCVSSGTPTAIQLIGRLPFVRQQGCDTGTFGLDVGENINPLQNPNALHYVVSRNLVFSTAINPTTLLASPDWLTVYDSFGQVLAPRVAFIVIHPGFPLPGQNRSSPTANTAQFLDRITVPVQGLINHANVNLNPSPFAPRFVVANATSSFNDQLVYVTTEEILRKVELRHMNPVKARIVELIPATPLPASYPADITTDATWTATPANWRSHWTYQVRADCITGGIVTGCGAPGGIEYPPASGIFHDAVVRSDIVALGTGGVGQFFAFP